MDTMKNDPTSEHHIKAPLNLSWCFGVNKNIPVLNLSDEDRKAIFYVTAHTGILYDIESNTQVLYQGHCNEITCTTVSEDKRWLATADVGKECMLIIWDTKQSVPIKTLFEVDTTGIVSGTFSADAKYLATLGCTQPQGQSFCQSQVGEGFTQILATKTVSKVKIFAVWDWTMEHDAPVANISLDINFGLQTHMRFNGSDASLLVSNNSEQMILYQWDMDGEVKLCAPELKDKDFNKTVGLYSQSVFEPFSSNILTASSCGNIIVWMKGNSASSFEYKAVKMVKIQEKAISTLTTTDGYVVTTDVGGSVKFFDLELKLVNWYKNLGCEGTINSISFTYQEKSKSLENNMPTTSYGAASTLEGKPFIVNDFSLSTTKANILYVKDGGSVVECKRKEQDKDVRAIASHPKGPYLAIGGFGGLLQVADFETKCLLHTKQLNESHIQITTLAFSHEGDFLAVGFGDGHVYILDAVTLEIDGFGEELASFQFSNDSVSKLVFSHNTQHLACSVEYDMKTSTVDNLKLLSRSRINQSAKPICIMDYPNIVKESFFVVGNDEFKLKLYNSTTKMCRSTFLGPTYGSPLQRMHLLPEIKGADSRYMAYITTNKVGLIILPLDGNPFNSVALIAHPGQVHNLSCSHDGRYVFTAGGKDASVLMWQVDADALEASAALGGEGLLPYYTLIEGGRDGELFAELEDYFYYSQIRNQGIESMETRNVSGEIPLSEIPFIMRALGYYPTEQEVDEMINEVKFKEYVITGKYIKAVDLATLIKLYVNHRPAFGLQINHLTDAFKKLGTSNGENEKFGQIERGQFLDMLQEKGEHMTEQELADYVTMMLDGRGDDEFEGEVESSNEEVPELKSLEDILPKTVNVENFASNILGFEEI